MSARALCLLGAAAAACGGTEVAPFRVRPERTALEHQESRLWQRADEFERSVDGSALLVPDDALRQYLQGVLDRLYPEFDGALRVRVLRSPEVNAFTFPNGLVFVHSGILSLLGNEAQVATLLGHEGAHFTHRHALEQRANVENALYVAMFGSIIPLGADLLAMSSISGFSKGHEREADREGFERMRRAGYDPAESVATFRRLLAHAEAVNEETPLFFATHPALEERIESFEAMIPRPVAGQTGAAAAGERGEDAYLAATRAVRHLALEEDLERRAHASVLASLAFVDARLTPAEASWLRGEALRQRAGAGDLESARDCFREAVAQDPGLAAAHRALGRASAKLGNSEEARTHLERYLELAPAAPDRAYVTAELVSLRP
jgi:beta-barrel assembly-enhancing protease